MLVHRRITPSIRFGGTHSYTWVERGTVRVKWLDLAQKHNAMSLARAQTWTARSGVERTNHEATVPPFIEGVSSLFIYLYLFIFSVINISDSMFLLFRY